MVSVAGKCFWVLKEFFSALCVAIWSYFNLLQTYWKNISHEHGWVTWKWRQNVLWMLNPDLVEEEILPSNVFLEMLLQKCCGYSLDSIMENEKTGMSHDLSYVTDTPSSLLLKILALQMLLLLWTINKYFIST